MHPAKIKVVCVDTTGLLATMTDAISSANANISSASIVTSEDKTATCIFELRVRNLNHLRAVLKSLEKIKGVISAERIRQ